MTVNTVKFSQFGQVNLANPTNAIVGVSSPSGGTNFQAPFPLSWDTLTRPTSPSPGTTGYNTSLAQLEYWNGTGWVQLSAGGSGTVGIGGANQIAYYPFTGTAVGGLTSLASAGLLTNALGVPSWVAATGTGAPVLQTDANLEFPNFVSPLSNNLQFTTTEGIIGTVTNDNASAGSVGYFVSSVIPAASAVPLTNNTNTNVTFIDLTSGDWDVWGNVFFIASVASVQYAGWISQISASVPDVSLLAVLNIPVMTSCGFVVPGIRQSLGSLTRIFLSVNALFTGSPGQITACGGIYARIRR